MSDLFDQLDAPTAAAEGGYTFNKDDPGGETNHGITVGEARRNGYTGAMKDMTADQAKAIRRSEYYMRPGIYLLAPVSAKIAAEVYDAGVLCGQGTAAQWLQRSLNVLNRQGLDYADVDVDGAIGTKTAAALKAYLEARPTGGEMIMLRALNCLQGAYFITIGERNPKLESFENGWFSNRIGIAQ